MYLSTCRSTSTRAENSRQQLLATWRRAKGKERDALLWGDEIEYLVVTYDDDKRQVRLSLRQADILEALASDEKLLAQGGGVDEIQRGSARYCLSATHDAGLVLIVFVTGPARQLPFSTPSSAVSCSRRLLDDHGALT